MSATGSGKTLANASMNSPASASIATSISMSSFVDFGSVNIDDHLACGAGEAARVVGGDDVVQPAADRDQQVAILHGEIRRPQRDDARAADVQRVIPGQQVEGVPGGDHRDLQALGESRKALRRAGQVHAVPGQQQRAL